jgi:peptidoglycan/LPS O-acetylase OafA/YrhL
LPGRGAFCFVYIGCCAAAWQLQRRGYSQTAAPWMLPGRGLIPLLGIAGFAVILSTLKRNEWLAIAAAALAIMALYAIARTAHGRRG